MSYFERTYIYYALLFLFLMDLFSTGIGLHLIGLQETNELVHLYGWTTIILGRYVIIEFLNTVYNISRNEKNIPVAFGLGVALTFIIYHSYIVYTNIELILS